MTTNFILDNNLSIGGLLTVKHLKDKINYKRQKIKIDFF
jgi:hypothetical protein